MSAVRAVLVPGLLLLTSCGGTTYAIQPSAATQLDDADWVIKHEPAPPAAVASADSTAAPEAAPPAPEVAPPAPEAAPPLR